MPALLTLLLLMQETLETRIGIGILEMVILHPVLTPTHNYTQPGIYTVLLNADAPNGCMYNITNYAIIKIDDNYGY